MSKSLIVSTLFVHILVGQRLLAEEDDQWQVVLPALTNGDVNGDWALDVSDPVYLLGHLFLGGSSPVPVLCGAEIAATLNGDANGDGELDLSDGIRLLGFLHEAGPAPVPACGPGVGGGSQATTTPFTVIMVFDPSGPNTEGKQWIDEDGIWHIRKGLQSFTVSGDFNGTFLGVANLNLDLNTLEGDGFGSFHMEVDWQGTRGTWGGKYNGPVSGGALTTKFVAQGGGGFANMKIMGTAVQTDSGFVATGVVLTSGG